VQSAGEKKIYHTQPEYLTDHACELYQFSLASSVEQRMGICPVMACSS
jgi:hypothetical protein